MFARVGDPDTGVRDEELAGLALVGRKADVVKFSHGGWSGGVLKKLITDHRSPSPPPVRHAEKSFPGRSEDGACSVMLISKG